MALRAVCSSGCVPTTPGFLSRLSRARVELGSVVGIVFDGVAYGSLLFLISMGLSVTLGVMNFVNLAHGAFAMFGGYVTVVLMQRLQWPFLATLPVAFIALAGLGAGLEWTLFRRLYGQSPLRQVLFTIGLTFMAVASATFVWGSAQQAIVLPPGLQGQLGLFGVEVGVYRLFLVGLVVVIGVGLYLLVERTRFGAQLRASVDDAVAAEGLGVDVSRVFRVTFALGSGLAGLGGALGIEVLGLDPNFALQYLVYFLLVVSVAGKGSIFGTAVAAVGLGLFDVLGKYYLPELGAFVIYGLMVTLLLLLPDGLRGVRG